jgi:hypothetical protein
MAADYKLRDDIRVASARIIKACETLERHFPLSPVVKEGMLFRHRNPLEMHRRFYEATATYLEEVLNHLEQHEEAISDNSDLPEDLPGRTALLRAGYTSEASVKPLSQEDLTALRGVGEATAKRIVSALRTPQPQKMKTTLYEEKD